VSYLYIYTYTYIFIYIYIYIEGLFAGIYIAQTHDVELFSLRHIVCMCHVLFFPTYVRPFCGKTFRVLLWMYGAYSALLLHDVGLHSLKYIMCKYHVISNI